MFLADVAVAAGKKITKDVKTLGDNTESAAVALWNGDKEKLAELSDTFAKNAAVGCIAVAAKKAGLGAVTALVNGDDVAETVGETLGVVNPVIGAVISANVVLAAVTKIAADGELQADIKRAANKAGLAVWKKVLG